MSKILQVYSRTLNKKITLITENFFVHFIFQLLSIGKSLVACKKLLKTYGQNHGLLFMYSNHGLFPLCVFSFLLNELIFIFYCDRRKSLYGRVSALCAVGQDMCRIDSMSRQTKCVLKWYQRFPCLAHSII